MSRDPSHQSSGSLGSNRSLPQARGSIPNLSNQTFSSSPASQIMQRPRSRRPSVVETEPSPRLVPFELDPVVTSYQLYNDNRHTSTGASKRISRGRKRGGSIPTTAQVYPSSSSPKFLSRFRPLRLRSDRRRHKRSESADGLLEYEAVGASEHNSESSPTRTIAGEEMARSVYGSGGIRLDEDTVFEFGSPPGQAAAAIDEVRRKSPKADRSSPLAASPFKPPGQGNESPILPRGSPPGEVGLGIQ
jgi:hypothetical protein